MSQEKDHSLSVGFVAGTFDHLHIGHQYILWKAFSLCDRLIVTVARDRTVKEIKGFWPSDNEENRLRRLEEEFIGTNAIIQLGRPDLNFIKTLEEAQPHKVFVGYDQQVPIGLKKGPWDIVPLDPYFPNIFKSSFFRNL